MSQETKTHTAEPQTAAAAQQPSIPKNLPIELLPVYDWWKANGNQTLIMLLTTVILLGGAWAYKQYRESKLTGANKELIQANTLEELESAVAKYGSTQAGNALRLRLAKFYYDASNFESALNTYETCLGKGAPDGFVEIAKLGRAHSLEGLARLDDALAAYEAFSKDFPTHFLAPHAKLGIARIYTLQGKKAEAKKLLENLKAQKTDNPGWEMTIANLEGVVDRYEPRAARSLFEAANEAAKTIKAPTATLPAPVALPVPAPAAK